MTRINKRKLRKIYKTAVDGMHEALGQEVVVHYKTGVTKNPNALPFDPVNNEPWDPNAAGRDGAANVYMDEISTKKVDAIVTWIGNGERFRPVELAGGEIDRTDVQLGFKLSEVLLDPNNRSGATMLDSLEKVVIDGMTVLPKTTPFKHALVGNVYRCFMICSLDNSV